MCSVTMYPKKIKLDKESIGDILVAYSDSESDSNVSDLEESEVEDENPQTSTDVGLEASTSGELPTWGPPQGRNTNIHPFVGPAKGLKKSEAPHINKDSSPLSVLMLFFTEIFHLLVEQTNVY